MIPPAVKVAADAMARSEAPLTWATANEPDEDLRFRGGVLGQLSALQHIGDLLSIHFRVVGSHTSKSVELPVCGAKLNTDAASFVFVRNNFHDIKAVFVGALPIELPYAVVHQEQSEAWLSDTVERARNYSGPDAYDYTSDAWYRRYSGGKIIRHDGRLYTSHLYQHCYCEGVDRLGLPDDVFEPFENGRPCFVVPLYSYAKLAYVIELARDATRQAFRETGRAA